MSDINLEIKQGATYRASFYYKNEDGTPVNLTGFSAKMQIRPKVDSEDVYKTLSTNPVSGEGEITISVVDGGIHIHLTDEETLMFSWSYGVYDLFVIADNQPAGDAYRVVGGRVSVVKSVTRIS